MPDTWLAIVQAGGAAVLALVVWLLVYGKLHTDGEYKAWEGRATRAEALVDRLIPTVELLADQVKTQTEASKRQDETLARLLGALERGDGGRLRPHS